MWRLSSLIPSGRQLYDLDRTKTERRHGKTSRKSVAERRTAEAANPRPFTGKRRAASSLAHWGTAAFGRIDVITPGSRHDRWSAQRDQDRRAPCGAGAGGGRVAGGRRAQRARGAGRGDRLGVRGRGVSRGGRDARPQGRRRVGEGRDGGQGEGADRGRVALHAQGSGRIHLLPLRSVGAAHAGGDQVGDRRDRVRDGAAALGGPPLAHAAARGGGADGGAGGGEVSREGVRRERDTARGGAGGTAGGSP